eukprot:c20094_g1_i4.p1 GENE.c20094_g1_i4~~c20094_g1_i4.p1  ORF type:complete len:336 (+),score=82.63 c20094_g1_i4:38-1045(+)
MATSAVIASARNNKQRKPEGAEAAHTNELPQSQQIEDLKDWSVDQVVAWLRNEGFGEWTEKFARHEIDGDTLLLLTSDDLKEIGVRRVGPRVDILDRIKVLTQKVVKPHAQTLKVPSWPVAILQFFTFAWAETSEGKTASEKKEELQTANLSISLISVLLTGMTYGWFTSTTNTCFCQTDNPELCFCSAGFDLDGDPLWLFHIFSGIASLCFLCSTVFAVLQIVAMNEMSDDDEISNFFDLLDSYESLPGKLVSFGLLFTCLATCVYIVSTGKLGLQTHMHLPYPWIAIIGFCLITLYAGYALTSMIRSVYRAKIEVAALTKNKVNELGGVSKHK